MLLNKRNTGLSGRLGKIKTDQKQPKWYVRRDSNPGHLRTLPLSHAGIQPVWFTHCTYLTQFRTRCNLSVHAGIGTSSACREGYTWLFVEKILLLLAAPVVTDTDS